MVEKTKMVLVPLDERRRASSPAFRRFRAEVYFTADPCADLGDIAEFITDTLGAWGGQKHPDDPLFQSLDVKEGLSGVVEMQRFPARRRHG